MVGNVLRPAFACMTNHDMAASPKYVASRADVSAVTAAFLHRLVDTSCCNARRQGKCVHAQTERSQAIFAQHRTRMNRAQSIDQTCHVSSFSGRLLE